VVVGDELDPLALGKGVLHGEARDAAGGASAGAQLSAGAVFDLGEAEGRFVVAELDAVLVAVFDRGEQVGLARGPREHGVAASLGAHTFGAHGEDAPDAVVGVEHVAPGFAAEDPAEGAEVLLALLDEGEVDRHAAIGPDADHVAAQLDDPTEAVSPAPAEAEVARGCGRAARAGEDERQGAASGEVFDRVRMRSAGDDVDRVALGAAERVLDRIGSALLRAARSVGAVASVAAVFAASALLAIAACAAAVGSAGLQTTAAGHMPGGPARLGAGECCSRAPPHALALRSSNPPYPRRASLRGKGARSRSFAWARLCAAWTHVSACWPSRGEEALLAAPSSGSTRPTRPSTPWCAGAPR
jgi:hypothetical protein